MILSPFYPLAKTLVFVMLGGHIAHAYEVGCLYPQEMPEPFTARDELLLAASANAIATKLETPVVVHQAHQSTYCASNCVAYHDDTSLNAITKRRPLFSTPSEYFNSWSRTLCLVQCTAMIYPSSAASFAALFSTWNFQPLPPSLEIAGCGQELNCLQTIAEREDYDPRVIGQVVFFEIAAQLGVDGWNSLGRLTYDSVSDSPVECTANCAAYSDTTGYFPRNNPGKKVSNLTNNKEALLFFLKQMSFLGHPMVLKSLYGTEVAKYTVQGTDKYWQPLLESDDRGYYMRQAHVTPHIGYSAKPLLITEFKKAEYPDYHYRAEADLVVKRLEELVADEDRIEKLRFFDNKLFVRALIQISLTAKYDITFEDYIMFISGISSAEHDAVLQSWREKVRFDLVRPTTVIQRWNDDVIYTYNGNPDSTEPEDIKARDFQSFIRVMPHSEYPSGSASICTSYADFTDLFTQEYFGETLELLPVGPGGISIGCDDMDYAFRLGCGPTFQVQNMTELASVCGASRLWGGMHFTQSVEAGNEIVAGIGQLALDFVKTIKAGSNWTDAHTRGKSRPLCTYSR